jgi:hypothetical protein
MQHDDFFIALLENRILLVKSLGYFYSPKQKKSPQKLPNYQKIKYKVITVYNLGSIFVFFKGPKTFVYFW